MATVLLTDGTTSYITVPVPVSQTGSTTMASPSLCINNTLPTPQSYTMQVPNKLGVYYQCVSTTTPATYEADIANGSMIKLFDAAVTTTY